MTLPSSTLTFVLLVPSWLLMFVVTLATLRRNERQRLQIDALNETIEEYEADLAEGQQDYLSTLALLNQQHVRPALARAADTEQELLTVIALRDDYHEWADKLAEAIARLTGTDIGEHTSANSPWQNALDAAEEQTGVLASNEGPVDGYQEFPRTPVLRSETLDGRVTDWSLNGQKVQVALHSADDSVEVIGTTPPPPLFVPPP